HPDLAPHEKKYKSTLQFLEDLTHILTMERRPLTLESAEEVLVCQKKEEKLKVVEIVARYTKLLANVKASTQIVEASYDNYDDRDRVARILVATHEAELKEFYEKNKENILERDKIMAEVEKKSEAIETLWGFDKKLDEEIIPPDHPKDGCA
ncbi:hypothetical protein KI387_037759, partial [Taxus chinensis]